MNGLDLKSVAPNSNYEQLKEGPQNSKNPYGAWAVSHMQ